MTPRDPEMPTDKPPVTADSLRAFIEEMGWTQKEAADELEIGRGTLFRWLSGQTAPPKWAGTLMEAARARRSAGKKAKAAPKAAPAAAPKTKAPRAKPAPARAKAKKAKAA
jgi:transcriptional regulator with XRE-family HTH domain